MAIPAAKLHKSTGQAYVYYKGKMYYFGKFGSVSADDKYWSWRATLGKRVADDYKVSELIDRYEKEGGVSRTARHFLKKFREELGHFLSLGCDDFGPLALREARKILASSGTRTAETVNSMAQTIQRMFKWGISVQVVSVNTSIALDSVPPLKSGDVERRGAGRKAVPQEIVDLTIPHLYLHVQNAIIMQLATGARPNEILSMRKALIEKDGPRGTWVYRLEAHKTAHKGKTRLLVLGEKAQLAFLEQCKLSEGSEWLFPSEDSVKGHYMPNSYMRAVKAGAKAAGVPPWNPYQLRHLKLTQIATDHGLNQAANIAGHGSVKITQGYTHEPTDEQIRQAS